MSDNNECVTKNEDKNETEASSNSINNVNTSTPVRLFGQFKQNGTDFGSFGRILSDDQATSTSTASYFTSTLSKFSATNGGGFGSSSTPLAASLAPLSSNKELFGASTSSKTIKTTKKEDEEEDDEQEEEEEEDHDDDNNNKVTPSLFETAAEYEAKRASTHPTAHIQGDTSTGEEHEVTKFQMAGKLYMYNPEKQQYVERGYGVLKINESQDLSDWNKLHARIIMRLDKAFRVILNSPIFPHMTVERATDRSVRFGAQDESRLRVFIVKASANDCTNLCKELQSRIQIIERQQPSSNVNTVVETNTNSSESSSTQNSVNRIRKRSHSNSDSDIPASSNDLSKKTKIIDGYRDGNPGTSDEDSVESTKTGEQETDV